MAADILVLGMPIWLGEKSSVGDADRRAALRQLAPAQRRRPVRLLRHASAAASSPATRTGVKHCAMNVLYSLQHLGYVIPPQADAGWIGEAGPGPSYLDEGSGGPENDFTNRNTTFATLEPAAPGADAQRRGGIPAHGNQRTEWDAGCRFDFPNPDYR